MERSVCVCLWSMCETFLYKNLCFPTNFSLVHTKMLCVVCRKCNLSVLNTNNIKIKSQCHSTPILFPLSLTLTPSNFFTLFYSSSQTRKESHPKTVWRSKVNKTLLYGFSSGLEIGWKKLSNWHENAMTLFTFVRGIQSQDC